MTDDQWTLWVTQMALETLTLAVRDLLKRRR